MFPEIWKDYPEFPCSYQVSTHGRVRSKDKLVIKKNGVTCSRKGVILSQQWHKQGMYRVRLCVNGNKCSRSVHRMVALTFLDNPLLKPEVNHLNGDRRINILINLEWATKEENMRHAVSSGLISNPFGADARHFKRSVQVFENGELVATLCGNKELTDFGLCYKLVSACLLGKQSSHRGYTFKSLEV